MRRDAGLAASRFPGPHGDDAGDKGVTISVFVAVFGVVACWVFAVTFSRSSWSFSRYVVQRFVFMKIRQPPRTKSMPAVRTYCFMFERNCNTESHDLNLFQFKNQFQCD